MAINNPTDIPDLVAWYDFFDESKMVPNDTIPDVIYSLAPSGGTYAGKLIGAYGTISTSGFLRRPQDTINGVKAGFMDELTELSLSMPARGLTTEGALDAALITPATAFVYQRTTVYEGTGGNKINLDDTSNAALRLRSGFSSVSVGIGYTGGTSSLDSAVTQPNTPIQTLSYLVWFDGSELGGETRQASDNTVTTIPSIPAATTGTVGLLNPIVGARRFLTSNKPAAVYGQVCFFSRALTAQERSDLHDWAVAYTGPSSSPHPGSHTVNDISQAADPNCIYFGQVPAIQIGDQFSFKETTETNGWGVSIDSQGYPIIDSGGAVGSDSFLFNISRDSGSTWTPTPPASDTFSFAIAPTLSGPTSSNETADGATVSISTNASQGRLYLAVRTTAQGGAYGPAEQVAIRDAVVGVDCVFKDSLLSPSAVVPNDFVVSGLDPSATYFYGFAQDADAV